MCVCARDIFASHVCANVRHIRERRAHAQTHTQSILFEWTGPPKIHNAVNYGITARRDLIP